MAHNFVSLTGANRLTAKQAYALFEAARYAADSWTLLADEQSESEDKCYALGCAIEKLTRAITRAGGCQGGELIDQFDTRRT
jgi:hypothetical protein